MVLLFSLKRENAHKNLYRDWNDEIFNIDYENILTTHGDF